MSLVRVNYYDLMSILEFQPSILATSACRQSQRFHELHSSIEFPNLRPSGADCLHLRVERGFRVRNVELTALFGIQKDNLATLPNRGFAESTVITVFDCSDSIF